MRTVHRPIVLPTNGSRSNADVPLPCRLLRLTNGRTSERPSHQPTVPSASASEPNVGTPTRCGPEPKVPSRCRTGRRPQHPSAAQQPLGRAGRPPGRSPRPHPARPPCGGRPGRAAARRPAGCPYRPETGSPRGRPSSGARRSTQASDPSGQRLVARPDCREQGARKPPDAHRSTAKRSSDAGRSAPPEVTRPCSVPRAAPRFRCPRGGTRARRTGPQRVAAPAGDRSASGPCYRQRPQWAAVRRAGRRGPCAGERQSCWPVAVAAAWADDRSRRLPGRSARQPYGLGAHRPCRRWCPGRASPGRAGTPSGRPAGPVPSPGLPEPSGCHPPRVRRRRASPSAARRGPGGSSAAQRRAAPRRPRSRARVRPPAPAARRRAAPPRWPGSASRRAP